MTDTSNPVQGQRGNSLDADSVDELMSAVLRLTAEVSALRERVSIWERVLESKGFSVTNGVNACLAAARNDHIVAAERDRLLGKMMDKLKTSGTQRGA